ncbi:MAG TPA: SIR2 family protein [Candidatus Acidoferrales bacterium]|nr:SIR2 family protein [Candidatus Acidoferrales bacterium]
MRGELIPFLGAGAPLYDRDPNATKWLQKSDGKEIVAHLPTGSELAAYLAKRTELPEVEKELTKIAQYYEAVLGPDPLRSKLRDIFSCEHPPTPLHEFLASVPAPLLIVTTNYDDLMERACRKSGKRCDVVVHMTDEPKVLWWPDGTGEPQKLAAGDLWIDLDKVSVIYKMHGAIDRRADEVGHYVITEDDYINFLTRMTQQTVIPSIFAEPFQKRPFLFLGYGLDDWNLRVILNRIQDFRRHPKFRSFAIETRWRPVDRKLWEARGIDVYDGLKLEEFLTELKKRGEP